VGWALACDRSHPAHPRSLLPLVKLSFLELLVEQPGSRGILRVVMDSGSLADQIETRKADFLILALERHNAAIGFYKELK
jgi:hypothetical protein